MQDFEPHSLLEHSSPLSRGYEKYTRVQDLSFYQTLLPREDSLIIDNDREHIHPHYRRYEYHPHSGLVRAYYWHNNESTYAQIDLLMGECSWQGKTVDDITPESHVVNVLRTCVSTLRNNSQLPNTDIFELYNDRLQEILKEGRSLDPETVETLEQLVFPLYHERRSISVEDLEGIEDVEKDEEPYVLVSDGNSLYCLQLRSTTLKPGSKDVLIAQPSSSLFGHAIIDIFWRRPYDQEENQLTLTGARRFEENYKIVQITSDEARKIAEFTLPLPEPNFAVTEKDILIRTAYYALESLQYQRWSDYDMNGPNSTRDMSIRDYASILDSLQVRFGRDVLLTAIQHISIHHFSALDLDSELTQNKPLHANIDPLGSSHMSIGRELFGDGIITDPSMRKFGVMVNTVPILGDPMFWRGLKEFEDETDDYFVSMSLIRWLKQYKDPNVAYLQQRPIFGDSSQEANIIGVLRDYFPDAFELILDYDPSLEEYDGPAFQEIITAS